MQEFDLLVIGAGPGGYVAAIRAAQLGLKTGIIERDAPGGICLNWGCIPTKALLKSAELYKQMQKSEEFGINVRGASFDIEKIVQRSRAVSSKLTSGIGYLLKKNKIEYIKATARLASKNIVEADGKKYKAKKIIIATGGRARLIDGVKVDEENILTYRGALMPKKIPSSMLIVGAGAIGVEFASFYSSLGCDVTLVEASDQIMPAEDAEISQTAAKIFASHGIKILTKTKFLGAQHKSGKVTSTLQTPKGEQKITTTSLLLSIGIVPNSENLGLEDLKIKTDKGNILVNSFMQTNIDNIYAIGDVAGLPWLAHKASHEGIAAAEHAAGRTTHPVDQNNIPRCTYSIPQIASVGLSEAQAKEKTAEIKVGRFPLSANGKALVMGHSGGLIKTIFDAKTGELLGAHMIGPDVTELIQGYVIAKQSELTEAEIMSTIFAHPTLSESMDEAVLDAYNRAIHI